MNNHHEEVDWGEAARGLDGRETLSGPAERLAEEIRADEQFVGGRLDVPMPGEVMFRVGARLDEALAADRPTRRRAWRSLVGAAAAAVVAAVLVIAAMQGPPPGPEVANGQPLLTAGEAVDAYLAESISDLDAEFEAIDALVQYIANGVGWFHPAGFQPAAVTEEDALDTIYLDPRIFGLDSIPEL